LLVITVAEAAPSQESGTADRQAAFRRLVQNYVQTGKEEYDRGYFEHALKTFRMAEGYSEFLTTAGREQLAALTEKAQTAIVGRKNTLETFQTVNDLIGQNRLVEARTGIESLAANEFLTADERAQIAEVLGQIDAQIAEQKAHSQTVKDRRLSVSATLEKIAGQIRTHAESQQDRNKRIAELYRSSMQLYRSGQFEKARVGLAEVAASDLIPPAMRKDIEGTLAQIDRALPPKADGQAVVEEKTPEIAPAIVPKVVHPEVTKPTLVAPKLTQSESTEETSEAEMVSEEPAAPPAAESNMTQPIMVTSPGANEGSHIEQVTRRRNIVRSHTEAVVNDAVTKARTHMGEGQFDKARKGIETALFVVNENQIDLGENLYKAHSSRLQALIGEIAEKQTEQTLKAEEEKRAAAAEAQRRFREQMEIDRQKRIDELMQNALEYQKQQRYEAALGQLESLLALDPQHDVALTLKDTLEDTIYFRKQLEVEKEAAKQRADILLGTDISGIPYAETLTYPKNWREIAQKPTRQPDKPIGLDPVDANVYERLEMAVDLPNLTQGTTFAEVIRQLADSVDPPLQIQPNWKDLLELGEVEPTTPAGMDPLTGVKLRKALELLLAGVSSEIYPLNYIVDEGVIRIATQETLPDKMVPRVYDITDLVGEPAQYGGIQGLYMGQSLGMSMGGGMMGGGMMGGMGGGMGGYGGGMMGGGMMGGGMMGGFGGGGMGGYGGGMMGGGLGGFGGGGFGGGGFGGGGYGGGGYGGGGYGGGLGGGGYGGGGYGGGGYGGGGYGGGGGLGGTGVGQYIAEDLTYLIQDSTGWENWADLSETGEGGTITPYPTQQPKKLAVLATHEIHTQIESLLMALRKALGHQVSIEARYLVVTESFLEDIGLDVDFTVNLGTNWGQITFEQDSVFATRTEATQVPLSLGGLGASANVSGGYGTILDDLQVAFLLRATQAHQDVTQLTAPIASVLSGESASFSITRQFILALPPIQQPGVTTTSGATGATTTGVGSSNVPQYLPVPSGSNLSITPIITHDKKNVLLNILTTQANFLGLRTSTVETPIVGGTTAGEVVEYDVQLPETETSTLMTRVSVPDGGTLLMGGQKITAEVEKEAGVPILSKIPIIGRLFGNRSTVRDHKILLILVKPTILLQEEREAEAIAALENEY
jgi:tetratricopeptide (TPR) repeat protein